MGEEAWPRFAATETRSEEGPETIIQYGVSGIPVYDLVTNHGQADE
jgi:hypothetical protein